MIGPPLQSMFSFLFYNVCEAILRGKQSEGRSYHLHKSQGFHHCPFQCTYLLLLLVTQSPLDRRISFQGRLKINKTSPQSMQKTRWLRLTVFSFVCFYSVSSKLMASLLTLFENVYSFTEQHLPRNANLHYHHSSLVLESLIFLFFFSTQAKILWIDRNQGIEM